MKGIWNGMECVPNLITLDVMSGNTNTFMMDSNCPLGSDEKDCPTITSTDNFEDEISENIID